MTPGKGSLRIVDIEAPIGALRLVGQGNRTALAADEPEVEHLQSLVFACYLMHYTVYGYRALRVPAVMLPRAAQDAM